MLRNPVPQPRHNRSAIGQGRRGDFGDASLTQPTTWGARASLRVRVVAPGPMCAEGCPLAFARDLPFPVAPARFRAWGQGHALAPHLTALNGQSPTGLLAITIAFANQGGVGADDSGVIFFPQMYDPMDCKPLFHGKAEKGRTTGDAGVLRPRPAARRPGSLYAVRARRLLRQTVLVLADRTELDRHRNGQSGLPRRCDRTSADGTIVH